MKRCCKCKKYKELIDFFKDKHVEDGLRRVCKICHSNNNKNYRITNLEKVRQKDKERYPRKRTIMALEKERKNHINRKYNLSIEEYELLFIKQNKSCAICNIEQIKIITSTGKNRRLDIDHDHKTGQIRGLLCAKCNKALGLLNDDIELFKQCINYLEKNNGRI